jgi:predicted CoA-substrate-specific enzyme activase
LSVINAGLDIGSRSIELVVLKDGETYLRRRAETSFDYLAQARELLDGVEPEHLVVTGYGRHLVAAELAVTHVTEIRAHAAGSRYLFPAARSILDIGGQDTKAMALDPGGRVLRFEMNDRCAAGTGRFLEVMSQALGCRVTELSDLAEGGRDTLKLSSMCTVFAETEVVSLRARGASAADVARALVTSIATRSATMVRRVGVEGSIIFCGGVARNKAVAKALEAALGKPVLVPPEPDFTGALGAAILAGELQT